MLSPSEILYCSLLSESINDTKSETHLEDQLLDSVFQLAFSHNTIALICNAAARHPGAEALSSISRWKKYAKDAIIAQTLKNDEFHKLYIALNERGHYPLLVKGNICASLYPDPSLRMSSDVDLLVTASEFLPICDYFLSLGFEADKEPSEQAFEVGFRSKDGFILVELHKSLFSPDSPAFCKYNCFFNLENVEVNRYPCDTGYCYPSLKPTDHFLFLLLHACKHFIHSGFGMRQLCDIGLWAYRYSEEIDYEYLQEALTECHAFEFTKAVLSLCQKYLSLQIDAPASYFDQSDHVDTLLKDILDGGVFGASTKSRLHASSITLNAVEAEREKRETSVLSSIFPSKDKLTASYPVLKEHSVLLPAVWIHRIFGYIREITGSKSENSPGVSLRIAEERKELLREFHII